MPLKNGTLTVSDAISICKENGIKIAETVRKFNNLIKKERESGEKVETQAKSVDTEEKIS
jgi:hypothetical protein